MSRPDDQERFEFWLPRHERERLDLLARTYNCPASLVARAGLDNIFAVSGLPLPDYAPSTLVALERFVRKIEGR